MLRDARQDVSQITFRIDSVQFRCSDQAIDRRGTFSSSIRSREQVILSAQSYSAQRSLRSIVVDFQVTIVAVAQQGFPSSQRVTNRNGCVRFLRELNQRLVQPLFQGFEQRLTPYIADFATFFGARPGVCSLI